MTNPYLLAHKEGETDTWGNTLVLSGLKGSLWMTAEGAFFVWAIDGYRSPTTESMDKALHTFNIRNNSNATSHWLVQHIKQVRQQNKRDQDDAKKLREWMRQHPEKVAEIKAKYGI